MLPGDNFNEAKAATVQITINTASNMIRVVPCFLFRKCINAIKLAIITDDSASAGPPNPALSADMTVKTKAHRGYGESVLAITALRVSSTHVCTTYVPFIVCQWVSPTANNPKSSTTMCRE